MTKALITISTGTDGEHVIHSRAWDIPVEAVANLAALLSSALGPPREWMTDGSADPGHPVVVYYGP